LVFVTTPSSAIAGKEHENEVQGQATCHINDQAESPLRDHRSSRSKAQKAIRVRRGEKRTSSGNSLSSAGCVLK